MTRKCPPGVICIENMSFLFLLIVIALAILLYFQIKNSSVQEKSKIIVERVIKPQRRREPRSVLLNPYTPPLKKYYVLFF